MNQLRPVETLVVDIAIDNLSDNYSSKPSHISPEFNNVMAAGATEISGSTLCCAQLGLALVAGLAVLLSAVVSGSAASVNSPDPAALGPTPGWRQQPSRNPSEVGAP